MSWNYPPRDDNPADLDNTQPNPSSTEPVIPSPMPHGTGHVRRRAEQRQGRKQKRKNDERTFYATPPSEPAPVRRVRRAARPPGESGLYLPAWSVILMLVIVFGVAGGIILLVVSLGGRSQPGGSPRVVVVTAIPSPAAGADGQPLPTLPAGQSDGGDIPEFALEGPLLPTIALSPTAQTINIGKTVRVINVGDSQLNVREAPGTANPILFRASEGDTFLVIDGPQQADGLTWWNVRSADNTDQRGWAAENNGEQDLLEVVPE